MSLAGNLWTCFQHLFPTRGHVLTYPDDMHVMLGTIQLSSVWTFVSVISDLSWTIPMPFNWWYSLDILLAWLLALGHYLAPLVCIIVVPVPFGIII